MKYFVSAGVQGRLAGRLMQLIASKPALALQITSQPSTLDVGHFFA